ncbi:MAG: NAD-dependent deacylase [Pseudomonadota bacterium]
MRNEEKIEEAAALLKREKKCVALTGAGISVPSGIPDFRSEGGLWDIFRPEEYATAEAWNSNPGKVWDMFRVVGKMLLDSPPNPAHAALGELESMGIVDAVVTQNIDGLHQAGGSKNVIEFHGNGRDIVCTKCGRRLSQEEELAILQREGPGTCPSCEGIARPQVVLFGEPIPTRAMAQSLAAVQNCRTLLVIGTSGMVAPASMLPYEARRAGANVIEINLASTPVSSIADISILESVEKALPAIVSKIRP